MELEEDNSLEEKQKVYSILNEGIEVTSDAETLRGALFEYFYRDFVSYLKESRESYRDLLSPGNIRWKKALKEYLSHPDFNVHYGKSRYMEVFRDMGMEVSDLDEIWKENRMVPRLKEYVEYIMESPDMDIEGRLKEDNMDRMSEGVLNDVAQLFGSDSDSEAAGEVKKEIIKGALGEEEVDLDGVDDEGLDNLLAKVVKVEEKVATILDFGKGWSDEKLIECVHEKTGMHLDESKEVIEYIRSL